MTQQLLGIDIGGTKCMFGFEYGDEQERIFRKYPTGLEFTKDKFIEILQDFISYIKSNTSVTIARPNKNQSDRPSLTDTSNASLQSIVISICGLVDDQGVIGLCELPKLTGTNIKQVITSNINITLEQIATVNDAYAALFACRELHPHETNMAAIICGTGIGSAFLIDGDILECNDSIAGWVGGCPVVIIDKDDKKESKILDDVCGGKAIVKQLSPISPSDVADNNIDDEKDQIKVEKILNDAGYYMGIGVCLCLNMMKCKRIVFAGGVFNFPYFYDAMIKSINDNMCIKELKDNCIMGICKEYNELVCIGTLILANKNVKSVPSDYCADNLSQQIFHEINSF